ncbi:MAG TPA: hypothetical protein VJ508_03275, partial [Saprospiraceae bacterium]|nr:hypothetical protein [Saprospiraceae bacterium]
GFVKAANSGQQEQISDHVKVLMDPYTDAASLAKGYYGYFSVSSPVGINVLYPELAFSTSSFAYHFLGNGEAIGSLADEIRLTLPAGTDFRIFTWEGKTY